MLSIPSGAQIQQIPSGACVGKEVEVLCVFPAPDDIDGHFVDFHAQIIFGDTAIDPSLLGTDSIVEGISLKRFSSEVDRSNSDKFVLRTITLDNFTFADAGLLLGCREFFRPEYLSEYIKVEYVLELKELGKCKHLTELLSKINFTVQEPRSFIRARIKLYLNIQVLTVECPAFIWLRTFMASAP